MPTIKVQVEIVSQQNIKPFSPTPQALKFFKFSVLDQLIPANYTPLLLWYPMNQASKISQIANKVNLLKKSLSNTLIDYYPLAGTMEDDFFIDCNDNGARFIETRVDCTIKDILQTPDLVSLNSFLPSDIRKKPISGAHVSNFQVNVFQCGGIALGICVAHKIFDGAALNIFLRSWTAITRGDSEIVRPNFFAYDSGIFIPATKLLSSPPMINSLLKKGKGETRRFVFDATAVAALKSEAIGGSGAKIPSRVEVVTAFLWKSLIAASTAKDGIQKSSQLTHLVNLRRKLSLSGKAENSIGNLLLKSVAEHEPHSKSDLHHLVGELRESFSEINGDFVTKMVENSSIYEIVKEQMAVGSRDDIDLFRFTGWCNFDFPSIDFGWGKPIWASNVGLEGMMFVNLIILIDTISGDGVEAWVTVDEDEMAILERDKELLSFASLDPSPLNYGLQSTNGALP